ncbi:MAG: M48 family metallopeptidase [Longimicrobiales bacterium]
MFALSGKIRKGLALGLVAGMTTLGSACSISRQQELQLGQQYSAQINAELPIANDAAVTRYVNALGNEIAAAGGRNLSYQFYVVNTDVVNAFAVPGGYVYVNRGLIEATDNLSELAGVMAHEIGHVEKRHSVEQLEQAQTANAGLTLAYVLLGRAPSGLESTAINVGGSLYFASHSREAELEADATAVELLVAAGIDPHGLVTFFETLLAERSRSPGRVEQWFATHPTTEERIEATRSIIQQVPQSRLRGLQTNSDAYQQFKRSVQRLPAPSR